MGQLIIVKAGSVPVINGVPTVIVNDDGSNVRSSVMVIVPVGGPAVTVIPVLLSVKDVPVPVMVSDSEPPKYAPVPVIIALPDVVGAGLVCDELVVKLTFMVPKGTPLAPVVVNGIFIVMVCWVPVPVTDAVGAVHCTTRSSDAPRLAIVKMLIKFEFADATTPLIVINPIINNRTLPFIC